MNVLPAPRAQRILDRFFLFGKVEAVEDITPRMRRIRIEGSSLRGLNWVPGQHIRLRVGNLGGPRTLIRDLRDALRTYSIWDYDDRGLLDVCVLDHQDPGPGARWSRTVRIGQEVAFLPPEGRLRVQNSAPYHVFVGDETASVAFGAMLRALPSSARIRAVVEVGAPTDRLPLARPEDVTWTYRRGAPATEGSRLLDALRALELPTAPGVAYVAGEARSCQVVRRHFGTERNWPRKAVTVKAFWAVGKHGPD